ncbi:MAG: membrane protein insertase YidC [Candidatus Cloacimonetes bacterium]|nr:membrane protein insertase YidC [Candidatus Cloacimonadota bacterium]
MDKRTLLAVILIIIVFWISNELIWKNKTQQSQPLPIKTEEQAPAPVTTDYQQTNFSDTLFIPSSDSDVEINDQLIIENESLQIVFTNLGATIKSIILKDYALADKITPVNLIPAEKRALNLELKYLSGNIENFQNKIFDYYIDDIDKTLRFQYTFDKGTVEKVFRLDGDYLLNFNLNIQLNESVENYNLAMNSGIADTEEYLKMKSREYKVIAEIDNEIKQYPLAKLKERKEILGKVDWAAVRSKYFILGMIPEDLVDVNRLETFAVEESPALNLGIQISRSSFTHNYRLYFGPLIFDELNAVGYGFENTLEMGPKFLRWISRIFLTFLKFLNGIVPNWGLCIIIFAIVLKFLLHPLTHKSFESSQKMQQIQPLMKEIQAKYKNDPKTMNNELRKLYKEHGVSPLGGCLPMLLQMPVLFALYPILRYSIDLRQAHFLWLPDLSEPDGTLILPITMAIFMFIQQLIMRPTRSSLDNMDEKQKAAQQSQKMMMYFMPVMMFFIFKSLASGLVLYWTVFSIASTIHQYLIRKRYQ